MTKRLTQRDLAARLNVATSTYQAIEAGYREASPREQAVLARALGASVADLFPESATVASR